MAKNKKHDFTKNRSTVFHVPMIGGMDKEGSRALRVAKSQIAAANEAAQEMGCGTPFGTDGIPQFTRAEKAKYMKEVNRRRTDQGEERLVNFDGGYGDET